MSSSKSNDPSLWPPKKDEEFTDACRDLILLSTNGSLTEKNEDMIELISQCSNYFLRKLVHKSAQNSETNEVSYDDINDLVHSDNEPWLVTLRESFRKRMSMEEVLNIRKKTMKAMYFFDYTHYNRHNNKEDNKEDGEQKSSESNGKSTGKVEKTPKTPKSQKTPKVLKRKKEESPVDSTPQEIFSSKNRKITKKRHFDDC